MSRRSNFLTRSIFLFELNDLLTLFNMPLNTCRYRCAVLVLDSYFLSWTVDHEIVRLSTVSPILISTEETKISFFYFAHYLNCEGNNLFREERGKEAGRTVEERKQFLLSAINDLHLFSIVGYGIHKTDTNPLNFMIL
jgi:hypothetical protein